MAYIDSYFFSFPLFLRLLIIAALMLLTALISIRHKLLSLSGVIAAVVVGTLVTYIAGLSGLVILLFFFLSSAVISHVVPDTARMKTQKKGSLRDGMQVFANGFPCLVALFLYRFTPYETVSLIMFSSAVAEAVADTWAGEIGTLSKHDPVSIITFTRTPKGISGGVSLLGTAASLLGAFLVALLAVGCYILPLLSIAIITISGALGALFDSLLGATVQVHYREEDGSLSEHRERNGKKNERARGIPFIDNDAVNLLSGLFALLISFFLSLFIGSNF